MKFLRTILLCLAVCVGVACTTAAFTDRVFVLDPPNKNLRGDEPKHDLPEADCNPETVYDCDPKKDLSCDLNKNPHCDPQTDPLCQTKTQYKCVVHFVSDYQKILDKINQLTKQLEACQAGNP